MCGPLASSLVREGVAIFMVVWALVGMEIIFRIEYTGRMVCANASLSMEVGWHIILICTDAVPLL